MGEAAVDPALEQLAEACRRSDRLVVRVQPARPGCVECLRVRRAGDPFADEVVVSVSRRTSTPAYVTGPGMGRLVGSPPDLDAVIGYLLWTTGTVEVGEW